MASDLYHSFYVGIYIKAISERKQKRRCFHFLVVWVAIQFWHESLPVATGFSCFVYMLYHLLLNKYCKCRLLFEFLCAKMPLPRVQHRRRHLTLVMMMHLLDIHVRGVWIHPINNLRFEKGEFFMLYPDLRKYEDCFFGWYRMMSYLVVLFGMYYRRNARNLENQFQLKSN